MARVITLVADDSRRIMANYDNSPIIHSKGVRKPINSSWNIDVGV